jgi:hypothetical protein
MAGRRLLRETARPPHNGPERLFGTPGYVGAEATEAPDQRKAPPKLWREQHVDTRGTAYLLVPPSFASHNDCGFAFRDP